jgi:hypothetical protein
VKQWKWLLCDVRVLAFAVLACATSAMSAQQVTGDIVGTITDAQGAVVPGAQVTAENTGTHQKRTITSSASGEYTISELQPGDYTIVITAAGFKTSTIRDVTLAAGDRVRENAPLQVGGASETLTVESTTPAIHTDSSVLSTTITTKETEDLPLNGRNYIQLAQLVPGANEGPPDSLTNGSKLDDRRQTAAISINGQSDVMNNQTIDGVDNNERLIGTVGVHPSVESIAEMNIQTNSYTAEVGRTGGGVIDIITRSGTNKFHGSLFEFFRNDIFDASYWTPPGANAGPKSELRRNQFGGSIGGPIIRDKTFFFADYEGYRNVQGYGTQQLNVPTLAERATLLSGGTPNFSDMPSYMPIVGGAYPVDPVGRDYMLLLPAPNDPDGFQYDGSIKRAQISHTFDARVDHHFNTTNTLFARFIYNNVLTTDGGPLPLGTVAGLTIDPNSDLSGNLGISPDIDYNAALGYQHIFTPNLLVDFRMAYTRSDNESKTDTDGQNPNDAFGQPNVNVPIAGGTGLGVVYVINGTALGGNFFAPLKDQDNTFDYQGMVTYNHGAHSIKAGGALIRRQLTSFQSNFPTGFFVFLSYGDLLHGASISTSRSLQWSAPLGQIPGPNSAPHLRVWEPSGFVQDDWRVTKKLTLNLGIRYDLFTPFTEAHNLAANFDPGTGQEVLAGQAGYGATTGVKTDYNGLAPRVGFAYSAPSNTVIRGGFGFSYVPENTTSSANLKNPPFVDSVSCNIFTPCNTSAPGPYPGQFQYGFNAPAPTTIDSPNATVPQAVDFHFRTSYFEQFNLTLQKELAGNVLTLSYVGLLGRQLAQALPDINLPGPNQCDNPTGSNNATCADPLRPYYKLHPNLTSVAYLTTHGSSSFNAVQGVFERRFSRGLFVNANYQWAHNLDDAPGISEFGSGGSGQQPNNLRADYGNSNLDYKDRFATMAGWQIPYGHSFTGYKAVLAKGWQVNAIIAFTSGTPFTVLNTNSQSNAVPGSADRPNQVGSIRPLHKGLHEFFNPEAFAPQPFGTYGNERRNQLFGPWFRHADLSAFKIFNLPRSTSLEVRAECFNVSNTPSFNTPNATLPAPPATGYSAAPTVTQQNVRSQAANPTEYSWITSSTFNYAPRQWQFASRFRF